MTDVMIKLSRKELSDCRQAASLRWQLARASGVVNQRRDEEHDDAEVDYLGVRAEMAVAKAYGLAFEPLAGIDDGSDLFAGDMTIDVKASFKQDGNLVFKRREAFRADVGVLVTATLEEDRMRIVGWVTRERFLDEAQAMDMGGGKRAMLLPHTRLASPARLWSKIVNTIHGG